jgi:hypothetical protein
MAACQHGVQGEPSARASSAQGASDIVGRNRGDTLSMQHEKGDGLVQGEQLSELPLKRTDSGLSFNRRTESGLKSLESTGNPSGSKAAASSGSCWISVFEAGNTMTCLETAAPGGGAHDGEHSKYETPWVDRMVAASPTTPRSLACRKLITDENPNFPSPRNWPAVGCDENATSSVTLICSKRKRNWWRACTTEPSRVTNLPSRLPAVVGSPHPDCAPNPPTRIVEHPFFQRP